MAEREPNRPPRVSIAIPVELFDGKRTVPALVHDLSHGGVFIALSPPLPLGTGLSFWLDIRGVRIPVRGTVRWTRSLAGIHGEPIGFGLEFYDADGSLAAQVHAALAPRR